MIIVKVELHKASTREVVLLGSAKIVNTGEGTINTGEYRYEIYGMQAGKILHKGNIKGFPRLRLLAWDLLYRVLKDCRGVKND